MSLWIAIAAYFVLACGIAAVVLLPGLRERLAERLLQGLRQAAGARHAAQQAAQHRARQGFAQAGSGLRGGAAWLRSQAVSAALVVILLALPPAVVFVLRGQHTLDAFDDAVPGSQDAVVATLLQGEQLVPPAPLPPEVFATAEVERLRPQLASADRRWERLDPDFRQRLLLAYRLMREEHGYEMALIEGYRSPERQDALAGLGPHVTNAKAWQSLHQHGLAADSAFLRDGRLVISERDPWAARGYALYGAVAQRVGLAWGGRWQNADLGHVELRKAGLGRPGP